MAGDLSQPKSPYAKTFECPQCGGSIAIRGGDQTLVAICNSCKSIVDVSHPTLQIIQKAQQNTPIEPHIPLGSRGSLHGELWEVIGYMRRMDVDSEYRWEEYLLFNPYQGYRWLTQAEGHWNYVVMTKDKPLFLSATQDKLHYLGRKYQLFHKGSARVTDVQGEFYWRVKVDDTVEVADYICPPEILSCEKSAQNSEQHGSEQNISEQTWSIAEYIEPAAITDAFQLKKSLPRRIGVAPNQPSDPSGNFEPLMQWWGLFAAILIVVQCLHLVLSRNELVFEETFQYQQDVYAQGVQPPEVSAPFELKHGLTNVTIDLSAPVSNTWLSIAGELVNEKSGAAYPFEALVEQYSGYDGGEAWSEGANHKTELLSAIPEGTYHLDFSASAAGPNEVSRYVKPALSMPYTVTLKRSVPIWSNFWWVLALLSIWPLWLMWRRHSFEVSRWSSSDYSPYASE